MERGGSRQLRNHLHGEALAELQTAENTDPISLVIGTDLAEELLMRPAFDPLRHDPRFQDLLGRVGLNGEEQGRI